MSVADSSRPRRISSCTVAFSARGGRDRPAGPLANCQARKVRKHSPAPPKSGSSSTTSHPKSSIVPRAPTRTLRGPASTGRPPRSVDHATRTGRAGGSQLDGDVEVAVQRVAPAHRRRAHRAAARTSLTVLPIGPSTPSGDQALPGPTRGTARAVGRRPTTPFHAAGLRSEPPMSLPSAVATMRQASADGGAAARPARRAAEVPWVPGHAVQGVERVRAGAELRRVGLADRHGAGLPHAADEQAVGPRPEAGEQRRAVRRREVDRLREVLVGGDQSGERTGIVAPGDRLVDGLGPAAPDVGIEGDDRVDGGVDGLDPLDVGVEQLDRRDLPIVDQLPLLDRRQLHQLHGPKVALMP